jgi:tetratricopeptide (TPR) repeat protein
MPVRGYFRPVMALPARRSALLFLLVLALSPVFMGTRAVAGNSPAWEAWTSETFSLAPLESFQMRIRFSDIPVRRWKLVVDGGDQRCDLTLLRAAGEELLYFKTAESRHEYSVPWGKDEEILVVLTNTSNPAAFVVSFFGPPRDQVTAAYSYHVNRALEAYSTGQRLEAEDQCRLALKEDSADGVAKVLFAGFQRDRNFYDNAAALVKEALAGELPAEMRTLAENMQAELVRLQAPLPAAIRKGLAQAESLIDSGRAEEALEVCDKLLNDGKGLDGTSQSRILVIKGQALEVLGRNYEAVDAYTYALSYDRSRDTQAIIHFHMGRLFFSMDNLAQARGALAISLQHGLPSGLDVQARELLQTTEKRLATER